MKMSQGKKIAFLLALVFMIPLWWNQSVAVVSAATPAFTESKVEIVGDDETYQLEIKNKVTGSKYKWSSSNTKVAKVSSKGLVTTVGKGSSTIKCKIEYPSGGSKTISTKVTVTIPATEVRINNATEVNGAHILQLGESFNFNRDIIPSNSSDKTYWTIGGGDEECIEVTKPTSGIVKAIKAGKVILVATAAKTTAKEDVEQSIVSDAIIIEVVGPSASVGSAEIINSTDLKVVFDSQIDKNSVIDANNKLLDSIDIIPKENIKGVMAQDPGTFTAALSSDMRTLIITASNSFDGEYGINFTSKIKTVDGVAIDSYYKQLSFIDTIPPAVVGVSLDDTGMIATVKFTEAVDFTSLKASNAQVIPVTESVDQDTIVILNNKHNYIASEDKKSLTINLSSISYEDYGKTFLVTLSGINDMSGNAPANYTLSIYLRTDTTPKPQARPITVIRSSYNTITATFDRGINYPGWANINGVTLNGVVDEKDSKKVNYTMTGSEVQLTGIRVVSIGFWDAYNVIPTDTYANQMRNFNVNFTTDKSSPVLLKTEFDSEKSILTLTYNKEVTLSANTGVFSAIVKTISDDIEPGCNITYTKINSDDNKVIKLDIGNMTLLGSYTFTLEQGFALDNFNNMSLSRTLTISNTDGAANELPGPYAIRQNPSNLSQIYLDFANKLDEASAKTLSNYKIPGVTIISAALYKNTTDNGATVILTVAEGSIDITVERPITITGLKGYNGSFTEMVSYTTPVELKDNKKPYYINPPVFDKNAMNVIRLNFNEEIQGTLSVKVTQIGTTPMEYSNTVTVSGNSAYITLDGIPINGSYLKIEVMNNNITDVNGNNATIQATMGVLASY